MARQQASESKSEGNDTAPDVAPAWWLCRIEDSNPREFAVLAASESEAVEKFKRGAAIRRTIHKISTWKLPADYVPSEQNLALEKRLSAAS